MLALPNMYSFTSRRLWWALCNSREHTTCGFPDLEKMDWPEYMLSAPSSSAERWGVFLCPFLGAVLSQLGPNLSLEAGQPSSNSQ